MEAELLQSRQEAAGLRDSCLRLAKEVKALQDDAHSKENQRRAFEVRLYASLLKENTHE